MKALASMAYISPPPRHTRHSKKLISSFMNGFQKFKRQWICEEIRSILKVKFSKLDHKRMRYLRKRNPRHHATRHMWRGHPTSSFIGRFWKFLYQIGVEFHQEFIKDIRFRLKLENKWKFFFSQQKNPKNSFIDRFRSSWAHSLCL